MVIVEPRKHDKLKVVIQNFHDRMPADWDLYVFHGKSHGDFAKDATSGVHGRQVFLKPLNSDNLTGGDGGEYNRLFLSAEFWNKVGAENILVFQTDTALCGKPLKRAIDQFLKYSYIGCAYDNKSIGRKASPWANQTFYGVGGLSLRKKSFMLQCIAAPGRPTHAEDVAFSWCAENLPGATKPESGQVLANFCAQAQYGTEAPGPFGVHKTNIEMRGNDKEKLLEVCPEAKIIE